MADEKPYKERMKDMRVNVYLSDEARAMLRELGRELFPGRKRVEGMVVETAIRRLYRSELGTSDNSGPKPEPHRNHI